ncbi:MAG: c-type cytochrome [Rhodospirillaceae bacterium]|nr:c-type cytochrome [Rhodospirillaceae bacterium]MBL6930909.1 c-type cytochrome [Rhodospirillales bacterium]MBL6942125.1 c-type cytochrome [Rhodospirillales bacterium]
MIKGRFLAFGLATVMALASSSAFADGDAKKGEKVFNKCKACHTVEKGKHKIGPSLAGVVGKKAGSTDFKKYKALKDADFTWDEDNISKWIENQKDFLKEKGLPTKTAMKVKIKKEDDREDLIAYLKSH